MNQVKMIKNTWEKVPLHHMYEGKDWIWKIHDSWNKCMNDSIKTIIFVIKNVAGASRE